MDIEVYSSTSEEETFRLGIEFSRRLAPGDLVAFYGDLGAGKTEFIKGICEGLADFSENTRKSVAGGGR